MTTTAFAGLEEGPLGYLGPAGTFTEVAARQLLASHPELDRHPLKPMFSAAAILSALAQGELACAVVPMENSIEGGVPATLDALSACESLRIIAQTQVPVSFVLAARPGNDLAQARTFATHPHAEAQVRDWITAHVGELDYQPTASTAAAAQVLGEGAFSSLSAGGQRPPGALGSDPTQTIPAHAPAFDLAVCTELAATHYGLEVVARDIGEGEHAVTRFVLLRRGGPISTPTGADRTTIVLGLTSDRAGSLLTVLEQFAARGVNLSRIESRPTGQGLGLYQFSIDLVGHVRETRVAETLRGVHRVARRMQFLGSYPALDGVVEPLEESVREDAFVQAQTWLDDIVSP